MILKKERKTLITPNLLLRERKRKRQKKTELGKTFITKIKNKGTRTQKQKTAERETHQIFISLKFG